MGLLARIEERASKGGQHFLSNPDAFALQLFGGGDATASGIVVTEDTSLEWTPLAAALRILCNTTAMIPLQVLQREERGKVKRDDLVLWNILHDSPNPEQTSMEFRVLIPIHQILWGNFFAEIVRANGNVRQLWPINPDRVRVKRRGRSLSYIISLPDGDQVTLGREQILHIPGFVSGGLVGRSLANDHAETIGLGLATERYTAHFFGNDASPGGYLRHPETLSDEAFDHIKGTWNAAHRGLQQSHRMAILEEGMEWQQVMSDPVKAEALGLKKFQVNEAIRIVTGVPPHLVGDWERATFANVEEASRNFVQYGAQPTCTKIEQRMNLSLLTEGEREQGIFIEHQLQGLLRGSMEARKAFYESMLDRGVMSINNVRSFENLNAIELGDEHFIRMDMQTLDRAVNQPPSDPFRTQRGATRSHPSDHETRSRDSVRQDFEILFNDVMKQLTSIENKRLRTALRTLEAGDDAGFREFLRKYYFETFPPKIRKIVGSLFISYGEAMARAAAPEVDADEEAQDVSEFTDEYIETFANRHSRSSRTQVEKLLADPDNDSVKLIEDRITDWEEGAQGEPRYLRMAEREGRQLGNLVARTVFVAAGALFMVSRAIGDSCPYCLALDGKRVSSQQPFLRADQQFQPIGTEYPLVPPTNRFAPPYHSGCDCRVEPG